MWWYGRGNSGGSWLPDEKKANMWHGRGKSGGSWLPAFPRSTGWMFKIFTGIFYHIVLFVETENGNLFVKNILINKVFYQFNFPLRKIHNLSKHFWF